MWSHYLLIPLALKEYYTTRNTRKRDVSEGKGFCGYFSFVCEASV